MNDLEQIKERNSRVSAEKAWETSWTRRSIIIIGTYVIIGTYLKYLNVADAWFHALVPAIAYMLSTLSLGFLKRLWINKIYNKEAINENQ